MAVNRKKNNIPRHLGSSCLLAVLIAGCTVGPRYSPPASCLPNGWHSDLAQGMSEQLPECFIWWETLNDPTLNMLMERAALQNLDLYIAGTRILEARMGILGEVTQLYPHVDGSLTAGRLSFSRDGVINDVLCGGCGGRRNVGFVEAGFDAQWEIDFFGLRAHEIKAACATAQAAEEALLDIWVTLSAEVAVNYVELRGLQKRERLLVQAISMQKDALKLVKDLTRTGFTSSLNVQQEKAELEQMEIQLLLIRPAIHKTIHRLSVLLGYPPAELFCELAVPQEIPTLPLDKPVGVPSELLRRRPDIRKAERNLAASTERIGSAIASLFPRLSLTGFLGNIASNWSRLGDPSAATFFIAPQLLMPIFNSTLIAQSIDLSKIQTEQALYVYQKTVLEALEETENAISSLGYEIERHDRLKQMHQESQTTFDLTNDLYRRGIKSYVEVSAVNRGLLEAADAEVQGNIALLRQYIALYKALGGGWEVCFDNMDKN